jgi:ferredoxin--NADP+ reductase
VPFDDARGTIPHSRGRVQPGLYTVGWAKRGARGGIGAGRADAQETAECIVADFNEGSLVASGADLAERLASTSIDVVTVDGWRAIDAHEREAGAAAGRPRQKLVRVDEMLEVAAAR